ncbi:MAG: hypothetical protein KC434_21200, partial [Anaerolineales bacterium]|nr:hypothetical protein [Anaerolineales bacterium]
LKKALGDWNTHPFWPQTAVFPQKAVNSTLNRVSVLPALIVLGPQWLTFRPANLWRRVMMGACNHANSDKWIGLLCCNCTKVVKRGTCA